MRIEVKRPCQALGSASAFDSRFCAQALKCDAALNYDILTRKAQGRQASGTIGEACGFNCATALRGARRSYSRTEPADVVATMSG